MGPTSYHEVFRSPSRSEYNLIHANSFPYLVRFRQCLIEYSLPPNASQRPLYNAIKYATAFPVIFLSAAQKSTPEVESKIASSDFPNQPWPGTFRLW